MDETRNLFLALLKASLRGERPELRRKPDKQEWDLVLKLAGMHRVLPLMLNAVYPDLRDCDPELAEAVKRQARQQIVFQTMKTMAFLDLNQRLQQAGVKALVVKGLVCRELYPTPDCRESADEDILICGEWLHDARKVLQDFGLQTDMDLTQQSESYEIPYRGTQTPLYIELHKQLFPPESEAVGDWNRFFESAHDNAVPVQIRGTTVYTLNHTDHLFYLICHAFKHFLHSGFGIRQVCDIMLYANCYGRQADWLQILENCCKIRADRFAAALFRIGQNHLNFDPERAGYPDIWKAITVDEMPLLEDLLEGGVYGGASMSRRHSSNITLDAVASQKHGKKRKNAVLLSVFPTAEKLSGRYPYLKKYPVLVPLAWCHRLMRYAKETASTADSQATDALKIGNERIALMREYGIIE